MSNNVKLSAIAACIILVGCAAKPYNAGQYALDNQRLTSETSLEAAEPNEQFSDAMKIMYDFSQYEVDYKNNLDQPYIKEGSSFKDVMSLGGTVGLLFSGAATADVLSFGFGTSYKKSIYDGYTQNLYIRYVSLQDNISPIELNGLIENHRKEMASNIASAYLEEGTDVKFFSPQKKEFVDSAEFDGTLFVIPAFQDTGIGSKLCRKQGVELENYLKKRGYVYGGNCYALTEPYSFNHTPEVRTIDDNSNFVPLRNPQSKKYVVLYSYLPDDFPMGYLNSDYRSDFVYRPSFMWLESKLEYIEVYSPEVMTERLKSKHITDGPTLTSLKTKVEIPFHYQLRN
ncbi:hypothetical protein J4N45_05560 [Vibrio sp. SCSIO 43140]|uniref:hypothetical protein n=1 Tax=Vibrio sp. SCSIO 43140 TaxID=2819100 RepID=UPI002074CF12|nr:hypothetical protein [Vibrio sp. SCSIO 43140]USD61432.1 hypothetical protein J4N45_05560 [Vibrio sp. SCSIO 43140]